MKYQQVEQDKSESGSQSLDDCEGLLSQDSGPAFKTQARGAPLWLAVALPVFFSVASLALGTWIGSRWANGSCLEQVQKYSPILKEVDNRYHTVRFNGSFMKENVFRLAGGPDSEVDAAWESLGIDYRSVAVPASEAPRSGLRPDQVQIRPEYGGGFPANVEGLHHLHCLNLVRQSLYYNIDHYRSQGEGAFVNEDRIVQYHVSHCLDIIRQRLMCVPDTGLLGQVWWDREYPRAFVDFNTEHSCRDFEAIRQWAEERQIPAETPGDFLRPPQVGDFIYESIP